MTTRKEHLRDTIKHLNLETDKDIEAEQLRLQEEVKKEISQKVFVGPEDTRNAAYQTELNKLNNKAQAKLMEFENSLESERYQEFGGSRENAEKLLDLDEMSPDFNDKSSLDQKFNNPERLKNASIELGEQWKDASEPEPNGR